MSDSIWSAFPVRPRRPPWPYRLLAAWALASAPSVLVAATLEDAVGTPHRPNLPGTSPPAAPNWSRRLPVSVERLCSPTCAAEAGQ